MSQEYNELVVAELMDLSEKLVDLLKREESYNARGIAAMLINSGSLMEQAATTEEIQAVRQCLDVLTAYPGAVGLLLGQLAKSFAFRHLGIVSKKERT